MLKGLKRTTVVLAITLAAGLAVAGVVHAQQKTMSIGTGGTGGVYYPLGGAVANVLSKNLPNVQATAAGLGGALSTAAAGMIVVGAGYGAAFLSLAAIAALALIGFCMLMPETRPRPSSDERPAPAIPRTAS
jgi:uncharacterized protein